jgi:imidazole glycerol-phosphate synthase subunit HisF
MTMMEYTRIIPILLLKDNGFVKTRNFQKPVYLGDCFNTVRLFNEKEADELMILDITATSENRPPNIELLRDLASECFMPLSYGGGVRKLDEMRQLFKAGFEKVSLNTEAVRNPQLIRDAAKEFGEQSIIVSIDIRRKMFGGYDVFIKGGREKAGIDPVSAARRAVDFGAGEILLNSIERDGMMNGYDLEITRKVADAIPVPLIVCGGAGSIDHFRDAIRIGGASAVAAGSFFVFTGKHRAVLITYPSQNEVRKAIYR